MRKRFILFTILTGILLAVAIGITVREESHIETWQPPRQGSYEATLRVAACDDFEPMTYIDENGNPAGHDVELIYAVGELLEMNTEIHMMDWDEALDGLREGRYDVLCSVTYSENRESWMDFSSAVMTEPYMLFGYDVNDFGISGLYHTRIALLNGEVAENATVTLASSDNSLEYYDSYEECFAALKAGACDYVVAPRSFGLCIVDDLELKGVKHSKTPFYVSIQGFAVPKGEAELRDNIDDALYTLKMNGTLDDIYRRWMVEHTGLERPSVYLKENKLLFIMSGLAIVFGFFSITFYYEYRRGRQVVLQVENERKLFALRTQMEVALKGISGGIAIVRNDDEKSFVYVGESLAALLGYTVAEFMEICHGTAAGIILKEDFSAFAGKLSLNIEKKEYYSIKFRAQCKDGSLKWISSHGRIVPNEKGEPECYSFNYDITEQEQARRRLEETAVLLRQEQQMYREALLHDCDYAYTVNVNENKINSMYNVGFLEKYHFYANQPYDDAMQRMVDTMKPVILSGMEEFHLTSHYIAAYEQGKRVVDVEYYIPDADSYKRKTIFLSKDDDTGTMYACAVAYDITSLRKEEVETRNALARLTELAVKAGQGDLEIEVDVDAPGDVGILADVLRQMLHNLKWHVEQLKKKAMQDALTGVKNKGAWQTAEKRLDEEIETGEADFGIVVCDINDLKRVNDTYGHEAGDDLIRGGCRYICKIYENSPIYRIGGDEFVVILEGEDLQQRDSLLDTFRKGMEEQKNVSPSQRTASIAIGMALYQRGTDGCCADVFCRADAAMYQNKAEMKAKDA